MSAVPSPLRPRRAATLLWAVGTAAAYALLGALAAATRTEINLLWPAAGVAVFALLARGPWMVVPVWFASWAVNHWLLGWSAPASAVIAVGNGLGPLLSLWALRRRDQPWQGLQTMADGLWFVLGAGVVSATVAAAAGAIALGLGSTTLPEPKALADFTANWWLADFVAIVTLVPTLDAWWRLRIKRDKLQSADWIAPLIGLFGALVIFTWPPEDSALPLGLASLLLMPLIWTALRSPFCMALTTASVEAWIALGATHAGLGPMQNLPAGGRLAAIEIIVATIYTTALFAALLARERAQALNMLWEVNSTLEKRVERRTAALRISQTTTLAQLRFQESLLNALPNPVAFSDAQGHFTRVNLAFSLLAGKGGPEIHGRTGTQVLGPTLGRVWEEMDAQLMAGARELSREAVWTSPDHEPTVWILNKALVRDAVSRQVVGVVTSMQDITALKQLQQRLAEDEQRFRFLAEESPVPLLIARASDEAVLFSNRAADALFRGDSGEAMRRTLRSLWVDAVQRDQLLLRLQRDGAARGIEARFYRYDGSEVWLLLSATRGRYRDTDALILAFKDITEAKERETELRTLAYTDVLTGIPNRRYFLARAALELRKAQRNGSPLAVMVLDIDDFKHINDTYGHLVGDGVIRCFASTCTAQLRGEDICGRLGGDEFAILLPQTTRQVAFDVAQRLRLAVQEAGCVASARPGEPPMTTSIGIAEYLPTQGDGDIDTLLDHADQALYRAKQAGRNRVEIWSSASDQLV